MNETIKRIFEEYVAAYAGIQVLEKTGIFDEEEKAVHEHNLLVKIVETVEEEIGTRYQFPNAHGIEKHAR